MMTFILAGAAGDLARRMLWPSLFALHAEGLLPKDMRIIGIGRSELADAEFHQLIAASLEKSPNLPDGAVCEDFIKAVRYIPVDNDDPSTFATLREAAGIGAELVFFLSTPPDQFRPFCLALKDANMVDDRSRIVIEKPIGIDLASSREVNEAVAQAFDEHQIFRIDHYLGKETVQNLLALRFGNALFEPLWNASAIDHVQITVAETVGIEGRWGYFDKAGSMRDMVQNHMLQLLALMAMEAPYSMDPAAVRNEKVKVLESLRPIGAAEVMANIVTGQYAAGTANGAPVPGYRQEEGAATESDTETFVAIRAEIDNWRWAGVPFYLRTGKRLAARQTEIVIQLKPVPHNIFAGVGSILQPNRMVIQLQPQETVTLHVMNKEPGLDGMRLHPLALNLSLTDAFGSYRRRIAYERLILDVLKGNSTLFVRRDEIEAAWKWIDGIHEGIRQTGMKPRSYPAGSWGPAAAIALTERHGHSWYEHAG